MSLDSKNIIKMLKFLRYTSVPIIISLVIFYLCCLISGEDVPEVTIELPVGIDKVVHFCMYLGLSGATALNYIYGKKGRINKAKLAIGAFMIPILYGGLIEIIQALYCEGRSGDWFDFLADTLGSLAALPIAFYYRRYLLNKN